MRYSVSQIAAKECESFRNLLMSEYEKRRRPCYPAHLWGERCPFTFVTSRQKMPCDVVRGQHLTPADDVGSAVTLPRKQWRHSGNPPAPLKNPDGTHIPSEKKGRKDKKKLIRQPH